jgi:putative acetyltransferase
MTAAAAARDELTIAEEDPRLGDSAVLLEEMSKFVEHTYPEDVELGIAPTMPDEIARDGLFVVARLYGKAVGIGALMNHPPVDGVIVMEVKRMYVREEARGRRVAEQILRWLEILARTRGLQKLVLLCGPRQPGALRLYERCGYSVRSAFGKYQTNPLSIFFEKRL